MLTLRWQAGEFLRKDNLDRMLILTSDSCKSYKLFNFEKMDRKFGHSSDYLIMSSTFTRNFVCQRETTIRILNIAAKLQPILGLTLAINFPTRRTCKINEFNVLFVAYKLKKGLKSLFNL